jgi:Protein of unknown function (DUF2631)
VTVVTDHATESSDAHSTGHRHERPGDWGWHAELGGTARIAGIISMIVLASLVLSSHGSRWELVWLAGFAVSIAIALLWDRNRRRNSWRS